MKLALMALAIEICLARMFAGSWGLAVVIIALYCTFVYVRQTILMKKQNKNKSRIEFEDSLIQDCINSNRKRQKQLYEIYPTIGVMEKN